MSRRVELLAFGALVVAMAALVLALRPIPPAAAEGPTGAIVSGATGGSPAASSADSFPATFNYQGTLRQLDGSLASGTYSMLLTIYDAPIGGRDWFHQAIPNVVVRDGLFNVILGDDPTNSYPQVIPPSLFSQPSVYIGVKVSNDPEMTPRQRLHPVPWALLSTNALNATNAVTATTLIGGATIRGSAVGLNLFGGTGDGLVVASATGNGIHASTRVTDGSALWAENMGTRGFGVYATADTGEGTGEGVHGIGGAYGVVGWSRTGYGVRGDSPGNFGVYGGSLTSQGVRGESQSGDGVDGSSRDPSKAGVYGHNDGDNGTGVVGRASGGTGVGGESGWGTGVFGHSTDGWGMDGFSDNKAGVRAHSGANDGIEASATAEAKSAVFAHHDGVNGAAVFGIANGAGGIGVWGHGGAWAGFFEGDVRITGRLKQGSMTVQIDHPLDPANTYLAHSAVASPDMLNVYSGNVTTDAQGEAIVTLPTYFEAFNGDFRYQLTVIGQFAQAIIATKIKDNRFTIKTDKPNVEVSWQVTGVRHDPDAKANPVQVEQTKPANERGYYLSPEAYGQPETRSIRYATHPSVSERPSSQDK